MTMAPLPASPCLRVRMVYNEGAVGEGGNRFYLSYTGTAPAGTDCATLASDIEGLWVTHFQGLVPEDYTLNEIDVLDIATEVGLSGQWTGSEAGTRSGTNLPVQCTMNQEFNIARRYRGGKPRWFLPVGVASDLETEATWQADFITGCNTAATDFFGGIADLDVGPLGTLAHVNLSYYKGFTNVENSSHRMRAAPTYRDEAMLDTIVGYSAKAVVGSQKRRRTSTTP